MLGGIDRWLLAEDNPNVFKALPVVAEARDGDEALLLCGRHEGSIHLMMTDVVMPGMSGRELADRVAEMYPEIKVLYMSGYTDNARGQHGVLDPKIPFIEKPFSVESVLQRVRETLDSLATE